jgi:H+/Cl- antiporter ClcA
VALQDWVLAAWVHLAAFAALLVLLSSLVVVLVEPLAAGSGIPETMSSLNGKSRQL